MNIKFKHDIPLEKTLCFEELYSENLQLTLEVKNELKELGCKFIYLLDGYTDELIGETYFIPLDDLEDEEPDEHQLEDGLEKWYGKNAVYVYSTTILPKFQGKGYASLLKSYFYGFMSTQIFDYAIGHARVSSGSLELNKKFGANEIMNFENWFQTGESFVMYVKDLKK